LSVAAGNSKNATERALRAPYNLLVSERPRTVPSRFDGWPEQSLTKDEMLDDITLYWLTNSAISSAQSSGKTTLPMKDYPDRGKELLEPAQ
jgi:hypothetical protein